MRHENKMKELLPEFTISLTTADADFMAALSRTAGDFNVVLQVSSNDIVKSTGMISIISGVITANHVGRVIEVAMSIQRPDKVIMQSPTSCRFLVNGSLETELMPIGMPSQKLQVTLGLICIPKGMLQRWNDWAAALGRKCVGWRVEELQSR